MAASYTKKQTLMYKNGYAVPVPMGRQQAEVAALEQPLDAMWTVPAVPAVPAPPAAAAAAASTAPFTPKYVQFDKQVSWIGGHSLWGRTAPSVPSPLVLQDNPSTHPAPLHPSCRHSCLQVLRYFGWFGEPVPDSPLEAWRVRKVCVLVYLEDGTMQVTEPQEPNSGITQVGAVWVLSECFPGAFWVISGYFLGAVWVLCAARHDAQHNAMPHPPTS